MKRTLLFFKCPQPLESFDRVVHFPERSERPSDEVHLPIVPTHLVELWRSWHVEWANISKFQIFIEDEQTDQLDYMTGGFAAVRI